MIIKTLTKEQEALIEKYYQDGIGPKLGSKTIQSMEDLDKQAIETGLRFFYEEILKIEGGLKKVHYAPSVEAGRELLKTLAVDEPTKSNYPLFCFQDTIYWTQFYRYFVEVFPDKFDAEVEQVTFGQKWVSLVENCYAIIVGGNECIAIGYPSRYVEDDELRLHNLNGPAVEWTDGTKYYFIDGMRVPDYVVTTPVESVTAKMILDIEDVDIRRCFIKRLGSNAARILGGEVSDKKSFKQGGQYELILVPLTEGEPPSPYLKMTNPSIKETHIEGVEGETVEEALCSRNGMLKYIEPEHLT